MCHIHSLVVTERAGTVSLSEVSSPVRPHAVERMWHMQDSQGQILALVKGSTPQNLLSCSLFAQREGGDRELERGELLPERQRHLVVRLCQSANQWPCGN